MLPYGNYYYVSIMYFFDALVLLRGTSKIHYVREKFIQQICYAFLYWAISKENLILYFSSMTAYFAVLINVFVTL